MNSVNSLPTPLDVMRDGQEFECLVGHQFAPNLNFVAELRRSIAEMEATDPGDRFLNEFHEFIQKPVPRI